jgi:hypothetical protein
MSEFSDQHLSLYTRGGERKYINQAERQRVLEVMQRLERERALFSLLLTWTGGRVSEALAVRANSFQLERNLVSLRTLKRRRPHVREVPIAPGLMAAIDRHFGLREHGEEVMAVDPLARNAEALGAPHGIVAADRPVARSGLGVAVVLQREWAPVRELFVRLAATAVRTGSLLGAAARKQRGDRPHAQSAESSDEPVVGMQRADMEQLRKRWDLDQEEG